MEAASTSGAERSSTMGALTLSPQPLHFRPAMTAPNSATITVPLLSPSTRKSVKLLNLGPY